MTKQTINNNKRIAKNTLMLYFRMFLIMGVSLYTSRVVLNVLGVEDFGIYNVVGGVIAMMGVLNSAMSVSTTRYITYDLGTGNITKLKQTFSMCFQIFVMLSIAIFVLGETVGLWLVNTQLTIPESRIVAANWCYQFSIIACISNLLLNPFNATIIAHEKMNIYAYISILDAFLKLAVVYLIAILPIDKLISYGGVLMMASMIITIIYVVYCYRNYKESRYSFYWNTSLFKELMSYSWWNLFGSLSGIAKGQGLNILLNVFFGPTVNASRGIAYQVNSAVSQFFTNFYTAVRPQITKYYSRNELENMFSLVFRSSKFSFYLIFLLSLPIIIEAPFIINLWLGQLPEYVVPFVRIIVVITAIDSMSNPLMTSAHATGNIKFYQFTVGMMNIMILPASYIVLKIGGCSPVVVFIVSLCASIISLFLRLWIVGRLMPFPKVRYINEVFIKSILIGLIASIMPLVMHKLLSPSSFVSVLICAVCVLSTLIVVYIFGITKGERNFLKSIIKKIIHRL